MSTVSSTAPPQSTEAEDDGWGDDDGWGAAGAAGGFGGFGGGAGADGDDDEGLVRKSANFSIVNVVLSHTFSYRVPI